MEKFVKIQDYPEYEISDLGNVKSLNFAGRGSERIMKLSTDKRGNVSVGFSTNCRTKRYKIGTLMAVAFLGFPSIKVREHIVDHLDGNKSNNRLDNLKLKLTQTF